MTDRLLLDTMCGKLATYLRMCGYDAAYALDARDEDGDGESDSRTAPTDDALLELAQEEDRTIVTRDRQLGERATDAVVLKSRDIEGKLRELAAAGFDLQLPTEPTRCSNCNGLVESVDPTESTPEYAPDPIETEVWRCVDCGQFFWRGSHWDDVAETLAKL